MTSRHKVFVSYYHKEDQKYRERFESLFARDFDITVSKSVNIGDIDPNLATETVRQKIRDEYISDATVTIVLVGAHTWQRKHVDWEISSSLRDTQHNPRCGLLGILLPTYPGYSVRKSVQKYYTNTIPPRLYDNIQCNYAEIYPWTKNPKDVSSWIDKAFKRRDQDPPPDSSRDLFAKNRSGDSWYYLSLSKTANAAASFPTSRESLIPDSTLKVPNGIAAVRNTNNPIIDLPTMRRDLYLVMSLLLADKEVAKIENVSDWTHDFYEPEVRRLLLWLATAARGLLGLLEKKKDMFSEPDCGEYWDVFPSGEKRPLTFKQACNSVLHAKDILPYIPTYSPEKPYSTEEESGKSVRPVYDDRITIRGAHGGRTTRAQLDIIQFVQIANALINSFGRDYNHANR